MKLLTACSLVIGLFAAPSARADLTMRSKMDYRTASYLPPAAAEAMSKQMGDMMANGVLLRIKGKRSLTSSGPLQLITDQEKGTITVLDPKGKRYAVSTLAEYGDQLKAAMPAMPDAAKQMLENVKFDVKSEKTGKTEVIKGIKAEEVLVTVNMEMPGPMAAAMAMSMEMHMWAATSEELERLPAMKELAAHMAAQASGADPASTAGKMFAQLPGFADKLKGPLEQMMKASSQAMLRTQIRMSMPGSAKMMGAKDPNEPLMEMTTDLVELSSDPIPDSAFQVPEGYQEAKLPDLVRLMAPALPSGPQKEPPAPAAAAVRGPVPPGVYRVGGGVTAPALISKVEPVYTDEARDAHLDGTVLLYSQVNPEGKPENIRVLHSLGLGLDQKAIEAVQQWSFRPGMKDGHPVWVEIQIEVNFRLLKKPDGEAHLDVLP